MSTVSKSPRKVAAVALENGSRTLPRYSHRFSRHDFTLPQLFACLALRKFFKTGYRDVCALLADWPTLCRDLGLEKVPHWTTLQKAERKLLRDAVIRRMISVSIDQAHAPDEQHDDDETRTVHVIDRAAADSTGFEFDRCSRYFVRRRSRVPDRWQTTTYRRFGKLGIVVDCDTHLILATLRGQGPRPDVDQLLPLLEGFCDNAIPEQLLADAGYDSEANHELLREYLEIDSIIPPTAGRPTDKLPTGKWRREMALNFDDETFGQRWQCETVMFMLKQHQGDALTARSYQARRREMGLMCVTHNLMIAYVPRGFLQGTLNGVFYVDSCERMDGKHWLPASG